MAKRIQHQSQNASKDVTHGVKASGATRVIPTTPLDPRLAWMDYMRTFRGRREPDLSLGRMIGGLEREFSDRQRTLGDVIDMWNSLVPASLRGAVSIAGITGGTLTVAASSSSASFELSRALRDGLERALIERMPGRVRRVKVKVGGAE